MSVPRYDPSPLQMAPSSEGAYVRYEDYARLEKALEQAQNVGLLSRSQTHDGKWYIEARYGGEPTFVEEVEELDAYLRELEDKR